MSTTKIEKTTTTPATESRGVLAAATDTARRTAADTRERLESAMRRAGQAGRDVYHAGIGVVAAADERGRTLFHELVQEGEKVAERDVARSLRSAGERVKALGERATSALGRGVQNGLERVGVPSQREISQLTQRIERLNAKIDKLSA